MKNKHMRKYDYQKMIELLAHILRCPICSNKYNADQTNIIEAADGERADQNTLLVHADCPDCSSSVVFSISVDGPEIFSIGMVTDLTAKDVHTFTHRDIITINEVIEFHEFLERFDGDFEKVIRLPHSQ